MPRLTLARPRAPRRARTAAGTPRYVAARAARIEHIAVEVDDLAAAAAALRAKGVEFTTPQPLGAAGMSFYFTRPETTDGVMYQFIQTAG